MLYSMISWKGIIANRESIEVINFNAKRFDEALQQAQNQESDIYSIGERQEKLLHATIKYYLASRESHEIRVNQYISDIATPELLFEVQTKQVFRIVKKLTTLAHSSKLCLVIPVIKEKQIIRFDSTKGTYLPPRTSPKKGSILHAFSELVSIRLLISNPNFKVKVLVLSAEERQFRPIGSKRIMKDLIPTKLIEEWDFSSAKDYASLWPIHLPSPFSSLDLAKHVHLPRAGAQAMIRFYKAIGHVVNGEKIGRTPMYLYQK